MYRTTRKTVRKWVVRYKERGLEGLKDEKRIPKSIPHKMNKEDEERIVELRKSHPSWGARRLKERYRLKGSYMVIHRAIRQNGFVKKKKKRWRKRKDLSKIKAKMMPFQKGQIDTKDLSDIVNYYPLMIRIRLPKFEYTYRDMSTGALFYAFADSNNSIYANLFARYVIEHRLFSKFSSNKQKSQITNPKKCKVQNAKCKTTIQNSKRQKIAFSFTL